MSYARLKETLAEGLETAYKVPGDDIAKILPEKEEDFNAENFLTFFLDQDKQRIDSLGLRGKEQFEQGHKKGKKETMQAFEKELKERFDVDDNDLIGLDLVEKIVELNSKKSKSDPTKLTYEELAKHPAVISLLSDKDKSFAEREKQLKKEFDDYKKGIQREQVFNGVSKKALELLDEMNPILSEDPKKAKNQRNILINELSKLDYQSDGDSYIPLENGKMMEDGHGHGISFVDLVKQKASMFYDFKKSTDRESPSGNDPGSAGGSIPKFKDLKEYAAYVSDRNIPLEDRQKAQKQWNEQAVS